MFGLVPMNTYVRVHQREFRRAARVAASNIETDQTRIARQPELQVKLLFLSGSSFCFYFFILIKGGIAAANL